MRYRVLWSFILLPLHLASAAAQDARAFRSQADFAREADSVRMAYRDSILRSEAELVRRADSVRVAYRDSLLRSQADLAREAHSVRVAYRDSILSSHTRLARAADSFVPRTAPAAPVPPLSAGL